MIFNFEAGLGVLNPLAVPKKGGKPVIEETARVVF